MRKVSKALKLKKVKGAMTIKDHNARISHLQKLIMSGKLKGILLQRAHEYIRKSQYCIRLLKKKRPRR